MAKYSMKIPENIINILSQCSVKDNVLFLPDQLESSVYKAVNKYLETIGGKWNRYLKGHVFDYCPQQKLDEIISSSEIEDTKKKYQFFPTPRPVAEIMCNIADIRHDSFVLEPSCGKGDLMDIIYEHKPAELFGVDINTDMEKYLCHKPYRTLLGKDFLSFKDKGYWDRIIMNPPFSQNQDTEHIMKAYEILKDGGILVSVVGLHPLQFDDIKSQIFRGWITETNAAVIDLPDGSFKESGTMVRTKLIKVFKNIV